MLFKRFTFLTCIVAVLGVLMANLIQSTHPTRSTKTAFSPCQLNAEHCLNEGAIFAFKAHAS